MATYTCPKGHSSATGDYCDTCGAPIDPPGGAGGGAGEAAAEAPATGPEPAAEGGDGAPPAPAATPCPGCGEPVTGRFCESCGYDVESGTPPAPVAVTLHLSADRSHWERMVGEGEPAFPSVVPTLSFELTGDRAVLGRVRPGATPEVDLPLTGAAADPAVSQRQCVFERDAEGWVVYDAGSSNGTWINDADRPLGDRERHRLRDGDRIYMGAWTCLTVRAAAPGRDPGPGAAGG